MPRPKQTAKKTTKKVSTKKAPLKKENNDETELLDKFSKLILKDMQKHFDNLNKRLDSLEKAELSSTKTAKAKPKAKPKAKSTTKSKGKEEKIEIEKCDGHNIIKKGKSKYVVEKDKKAPYGVIVTAKYLKSGLKGLTEKDKELLKGFKIKEPEEESDSDEPINIDDFDDDELNDLLNDISDEEQEEDEEEETEEIEDEESDEESDDESELSE